MSQYLFNLKCEDRPGIVALVSTTLHGLGANVLSNSAFSEPVTSTYCMRLRFEVDLSEEKMLAQLQEALQPLGAEISVRNVEQVPNVLVLVSKHDHCLVDLFYRTTHNELAINIPIVISNHEDLREHSEKSGAEYIACSTSHGTEDLEAQVRQAIQNHNIDFVVLARYMQIISPELGAELNGRLVNIHHSFLPGFKGAAPFQQAWERGVKMIGATAHFVTESLDEGPIITQGVTSVSHRDSAADMKLKSKDIERLVLADAVKAMASGKVFLCGAKTVVFD